MTATPAITDTVQVALDRLNSQLPLAKRQAALPEELRRLHRQLLHSLVKRGRPLSREEIAQRLDRHNVDAALERLGGDDLVVLDADGSEFVGAYPLTVDDTPHRLCIDSQVEIRAMCALDAVSVAPVFDVATRIDSACKLTGEAIRIEQQGRRLLSVSPSPHVRVGVRWQNPIACAAHSMCLEMVFLKDQQTAQEWQGGDTESISLFSLDETVLFGDGFFRPLISDDKS